jgi:hypothetical protein
MLARIEDFINDVTRITGDFLNGFQDEVVALFEGSKSIQKLWADGTGDTDTSTASPALASGEIRGKKLRATTDGLVVDAGGVAVNAGGVAVTAGNISTASGSVSASTTVTGGNGVTATTGNVTATAGEAVGRHFRSNSSTPSVSATGTGITGPSVTGNDVDGYVDFTIGGSFTSGQVLAITLSSTPGWVNTTATLTPADDATAAVMNFLRMGPITTVSWSVYGLATIPTGTYRLIYKVGGF